MVDERIVEYIKTHINDYPINSIRLALVKEGHSAKDINDAVVQVEGIDSKDIKYKKEIVILVVALVVIGGAAAFFFYQSLKGVNCGIGTYDKLSDSCEYELSSIVQCPEGTIFNLDIEGCEYTSSTKICDVGNYNEVNERCEYYPPIENICENGAVYNQNTGYCEYIVERTCAKEGEEISLTDIRTGAVSSEEICCQDLEPVGCSVDVGYCVDCGNNVCESPENECNCPEDCDGTNLIETVVETQEYICNIGEYDETINKCVMYLDTQYVCEEGALMETDGENKCVINAEVVEKVCGDNQCSFMERSTGTCPADCTEGYCGDKICDEKETPEKCPADCIETQEAESLSDALMILSNGLIYITKPNSRTIDILDFAIPSFSGSIDIGTTSEELLRLYIDDEENIGMIYSSSIGGFKVLDMNLGKSLCSVGTDSSEPIFIDAQNNQIVKSSNRNLEMYDYNCDITNAVEKEGNIITRPSNGEMGIVDTRGARLNIIDLSSGKTLDEISLVAPMADSFNHHVRLNDDWFVAYINKEQVETDIFTYDRSKKQSSVFTVSRSISGSELKEPFLIGDTFFLPVKNDKEDDEEIILKIDLKDEQVLETISAGTDAIAYAVDDDKNIYILGSGGNIKKRGTSVDVDDDVITKDVVDPIYVTWFAHNEFTGIWEEFLPEDNELGGRQAYLEYREDLVNKVNLFESYGAKFNWETDLPAIQAMNFYETGSLLDNTNGKHILRWMTEDKGVFIDPHGAKNAWRGDYTLADIVYELDQAGIEFTDIVGGASIFECGSDIENPVDIGFNTELKTTSDGTIFGVDNPGYSWKPTIVSQMAMKGSGHQGDDYSSGIWRVSPDYTGSVYTHDPNGEFVIIGTGYHPVKDILVGGFDAEIFYTGPGYVLELIEKIENGEVESGKMYTASITIRDTQLQTPIKPVENALKILKPYVDSGRIVYADYGTVAEIWKTKYNEEPNRLPLSEFSIYSQVIDQLEEKCSGSSEKAPKEDKDGKPKQGGCGDGTCEGPETAANCPEDCDDGQEPPQGGCGDGVCEPIEEGKCPEDC